MKHFLKLYFFLLLFIGEATHAQNLYKSVKTIKQEYDRICIDKQHNFYAYYEEGFVKYDKEGNKLKTYRNPEVGSITFMDINPAGQILLLFEDIGMIKILDKNLIEIGKIQLSKLNVSHIIFSLFTEDGNILMYDVTDHSIFKTDFTGVIKQRKTKLVMMREGIKPVDLIEENNVIIMVDSIQGIFVFDYYGKQENSIEKLGITRIQEINKQIIFAQNKQISVVNLITKDNKLVNIEAHQHLFTQAYFVGSTLIVGEGKNIFLYNE